MALSRCKNHPPANNRNQIYNHEVRPIGYPNTSSVCGIPGCYEPGLVRLTDEEYKLFLGGQEIFDYDHNSSKVRVEKR